jgi:hypothetical protein
MAMKVSKAHICDSDQPAGSMGTRYLYHCSVSWIFGFFSPLWRLDVKNNPHETVPRASSTKFIDRMDNDSDCNAIARAPQRLLSPLYSTAIVIPLTLVPRHIYVHAQCSQYPLLPPPFSLSLDVSEVIQGK